MPLADLMQRLYAARATMPWWERVLDWVAGQMIRAGSRAGCRLDLWLVDRRAARIPSRYVRHAVAVSEALDVTKVTWSAASGRSILCMRGCRREATITHHVGGLVFWMMCATCAAEANGCQR